MCSRISRVMRERTSSPRTFLIADVRGYTLFTSEHGDEAAAGLVESFARLTAKAGAAWAGTVVEFRGDEALAVFDSPRSAIRAAAGLPAAGVGGGEGGPLPAGLGLGAGEGGHADEGVPGAAA